MRLKLLLALAAVSALALGFGAASTGAWHDYYNPASYTTPIAYQCYGVSRYGHPTNLPPENWNAVDILTPSGTPVFATKGGYIASEGWEPGGGIVIRIQHYDSPYNNGLQTVLAHLSQTIINTGQWVNQNQLIGYTGNTGDTTGPHLHWGLWEPQTNAPVPLDNIPGVNEPNSICP